MDHNILQEFLKVAMKPKGRIVILKLIRESLHELRSVIQTNAVQTSLAFPMADWRAFRERVMNIQAPPEGTIF